MRHVPTAPELRRTLPWLAAERPEVFNAYQRSQHARVEKQLTQAAYVASSIGHKAREALFIGLYKVIGSRQISFEEFWEIPANKELRRLGAKGWVGGDAPPPVSWFDLELIDVYQDWKGKLILDWPPPEVSWTRWADQNEFGVKAILEESRLDKGMPSWNELLLTWEELVHLPESWIKVLNEWRCIYFIFDSADGKSYVGSAYGGKNLYGRWKNYAATGDGGNKLLRDRAPDKFRFSILERVSPDMKPEEVINLESNWKGRLHTRGEFGLNIN